MINDDLTAADLEFEDQMRRPKSERKMSKQEKKRDKEFRKNRRNARGRQWQ